MVIGTVDGPSAPAGPVREAAEPMADDLPPRRRTGSNAVPIAVLVAMVAAAVATWSITSRVVRDQEHRLLAQRADEVQALLANATQSIRSSLQVLGTVGSSPDPASVKLFAESASPLIQRATVAIGVVAERPDGVVVVASVGSGPAPGQALDRARSALASRALDRKDMVGALVEEGDATRLIVGLPADRPGTVAYQESIVAPGTPVPSTPDSPYRELHVALYAAPRPDPSKLILTTETRLPLTGRVERVPFRLGADQWLLAVAARGQLTGEFAGWVPRILLAGGLTLALLAAAVARMLVRRRAFALDLVAQRTGELEGALDRLADIRAALDRMLTAGPMLVIRVEVDDGRATYVSPNIERLCGLSPAESATPGFVFGRAHPDDLERFRGAVRRVARREASQETVEYRFRHGDGTYRWTAGVVVADDGEGGDDDGAGPVAGVLVYALDVHDRRRADEARREAQEAAEAANVAKSRFLSRMSHELRTPLNAVLGFGQLLELQDLTDEQREYVGYIVKGGRHLLDLINEVLDISRIEAGELALSPESVHTAGVIRDAVALIRPLADQRGIQVVTDQSGSCDSYVFADGQRAKQVLLNLLSNAVKYNRTRGTVAVSCVPVGDTRIAIKVTDTGPGIAAEQVGNLFMPFERLGAENTNVEGTGIGLALSRRLAEAMDGRLSATSTLGQGSTFTFELPRVEGPVERYERLKSSPAEPVAAAPHDRRRTVLHIEDNLANVNLMERILARRPDVDVVAAMQGSLGLELAREHRPALVLLDLHLPDMSGEHVLQRLREDSVTASVPVVMVSADATTGQVQRLLAAGATAYITKPIDVGALLRVIDAALDD